MLRKRVLPPPSTGRSWLSAGLCAGLLLGLAELVAAPIAGRELGPQASLALAAADLLWVFTLFGTLGLVLVFLGLRLSHSAAVGLSLFPLLAASVAGPALLAWREGAGPLQLALNLGPGLVIALGAGLLASLGGRRLEQSGRVLAGPPVWLAASLLIAASGAAQTRPESPRALVGLVLVACLLALLTGLVLVRENGGRSGRPLGRGSVTVFAALAILALSVRPWLLPWLSADAAQVPAPVSGTCLVALAVGPLPGAWPAPLELFAVSAERFEGVLAPDERGAASLLDLPDGAPLLGLLGLEGYATASFAVDGRRGFGAGAALRDARPGVRRQLEEAAEGSVGGALLGALAPELREGLGLTRAWRSPGSVVDAALAWSLDVRLRDGAPALALALDLRPAPEDAVAPAELERALERLVERLGEFGLVEDSVWLVAVEGASPRDPLAVLLRPPAPAEAPAPAPRRASEVAARLLALLAPETASGAPAQPAFAVRPRSTQ